MSWLFGRRKQKDSPTDLTEEEQMSDSNEGFVHITKWPTSNVTDDTIMYSSGNLYPSIPSVPNLGQIPSTDSSKDSNEGENAHYLNGVPFKLCKQLQNSISNNFEIEKLRISEILSFVERIQKENFDYSFSLEEGIVAEMNNRSDE